MEVIKGQSTTLIYRHQDTQPLAVHPHALSPHPQGIFTFKDDGGYTDWYTDADHGGSGILWMWGATR